MVISKITQTLELENKAVDRMKDDKDLVVDTSKDVRTFVEDDADFGHTWMDVAVDGDTYFAIRRLFAYDLVADQKAENSFCHRPVWKFLVHAMNHHNFDSALWDYLNFVGDIHNQNSPHRKTRLHPLMCLSARKMFHENRHGCEMDDALIESL